LEASRTLRGNLRKRWALRRRLKEIRNSDRIEELIEELRLEWETGPPPS
jgi:hypothetical protein